MYNLKNKIKIKKEIDFQEPTFFCEHCLFFMSNMPIGCTLWDLSDFVPSSVFSEFILLFLTYLIINTSYTELSTLFIKAVQHANYANHLI